MLAAAQDDLPEGREPAPGHGVHDLFARWTPAEGPRAGAQVVFGVENVLDKSYRPHLANDPARGRTFTLSLAPTF